jgi:hypothetical protein
MRPTVAVWVTGKMRHSASKPRSRPGAPVDGHPHGTALATTDHVHSEAISKVNVPVSK